MSKQLQRPCCHLESLEDLEDVFPEIARDRCRDDAPYPTLIFVSWPSWTEFRLDLGTVRDCTVRPYHYDVPLREALND